MSSLRLDRQLYGTPETVADQPNTKTDSSRLDVIVDLLKLVS